ncbi:hypothetical protein QBC38DRAFT_477016 [Podospora fimiseda]|uniref:FAD-binding PCMH-type domain-containing protein n=1 Tax=Podospora fimiseda TaxID=252190 RepID=A0AAN7BQU2_9PEZI|nr:hypothetical protein QBC38DRAFT_477016 [Podospora fimiseda]
MVSFFSLQTLLLPSLFFFLSTISAASCPSTPSPPTPLPPDILTILPQLLSPQSQILLPSSPSFPFYSTRFSAEQGTPTFQAIILPRTESDISQIIKYSNSHNLPFLAISGQHGSWYPLENFNGIGISLRNLSTRISLDKDGRHATIGGGMNVYETVQYLWSKGKQTTTGICECVGVISPGLGGGHGLFQGQYGLVGDQWVEARVVLADGKVVRVSEKENKDLWWGLRGAGHNYGVVSEVKVKVYDTPKGKESWSWESFSFKGKKLEVLYEWVNKGLIGTQPAELVHWSMWSLDKNIDPENPVITFSLYYNGPASELKMYSENIHNLGPVAHKEGVVEYSKMSAVFGADINGGFCSKNQNPNVALRASDVISYEIPALRKAYDLLSSGLKSEPAFAYSVVMLEGYSVQGVQAVPAESAAYPHRAQRILQAPTIVWPRGTNETLDEEAQGLARKLWIAISGTTEKRSYVNYAWGDEGPQALYGYEPWRLQKLRALKKKYDPESRFGYFASVETKSKGHGDI